MRKAHSQEACFLLMTAQTFLHKARISALTDKLSGKEVFAVILDAQGKSFEWALKKALQDGFRSISIFRIGKIPLELLRNIPEILEINRRTFLDADLSYGVCAAGDELKNSSVQTFGFYRGNKHDDQ